MALVEAVLPAMKDAQSGSIVNVSSVAAVNTPTGMGHYAATKAALAKYSEALHVELKDHGIHVVTVYPGPVATPMGPRAGNLWRQLWRRRQAAHGHPRGAGP